MRVRRGNRRAQKRKKVLKRAKGFYGAKSKAYRVAKEAVDKAQGYAYRDRRQRKRDFRGLWIVRINAAARSNGLSYNRLIGGLKAAGCEVNRKMLAELAVEDPTGFAALAETAKRALGNGTQPAASASEPGRPIAAAPRAPAQATSGSSEEE